MFERLRTYLLIIVIAFLALWFISIMVYWKDIGAALAAAFNGVVDLVIRIVVGIVIILMILGAVVGLVRG